MSNVSQAHDVKPYKAGDKPLTGQRLARVMYKTSKKAPAKFPSVAVSVPFLQYSDISADHHKFLESRVVQILCDAQDGILRSLYESSQGALKIVTDSEVSVDACIGYLRAETEGNRLTSDAINAWFDSELSEPLQVVLAEKLGFIKAGAEGEVELTEDQGKVIDKHVKIHKELFASLAGGATILAEKQQKGLKNALQFADERNPIAEKLMARLVKMGERKEEEFFGLE